MTEQPTTAAERALDVLRDYVNVLRFEGGTMTEPEWQRLHFLIDQFAIEAEARQQDGSALRAALERMVDLVTLRVGLMDEKYGPIKDHEPPALEQARAALAALPPTAPPALDVERLARALALWEVTADPEREDVSAYLGADIYENGARTVAEAVAAEYARLQEQDR